MSEQIDNLDDVPAEENTSSSPKQKIENQEHQSDKNYENKGNF